MKTISIEQTTDMMLAVCDKLIESKPYLTEIDSRIGDGDHGIGMEIGMKAAKKSLLSQRPFATVNSVFSTIGMSMLGSMGGASGVIFGSMFLSGAKQIPSASELSGPFVSRMMQKSLEAIKKRGGAHVGDKTMVDALEPAVIAMQSADQQDLVSVLAAAEQAAGIGVERTKGYIAKYGRAKSLFKRAIGYQDAGATSVHIILEAMYRYVLELGKKK
jgi:dihydroxyacetone kinase-like protein